MIGKSISLLYARPRATIFKLIGFTDIMLRSKWNVVWKEISKLPKDQPIRLLDAGCGSGLFVLEIAVRRPKWTFVGVDLDENSINKAKRYSKILGCNNCQFESSDFLNFPSKELLPFDVVLSVSSFHYLSEHGKSRELARQLSKWIKKEGALVMVCPRLSEETFLPSFFATNHWHSVYSKKQLFDFSHEAGLRVQKLSAFMFSPLSKAKILRTNLSTFVIISKLLIPLQWFLYLIDPLFKSSRKSLMWILISKK